ncbi:LOW QUALITY PROTEIN: hypothetical protein YC2023_000711 [Brassica napus]
MRRRRCGERRAFIEPRVHGMLFQVSSGYFVCPVVLSSRDGPVKTLVSALSSISIKK